MIFFLFQRIPEIGHFKVACDTVSVVSNCIMGLFWGRYPFFSDCDVVWETGTKFVAQNIPIVQFESHGQSQGRSLKKKFHLSDKNVSSNIL